MSLDVGLDLRRDKAARQGSWSESPLRAIVAVFVAAILLRQFLPYNVDVSWWLIVSERMLDGQRLYVDILETNPPMAGLVYFLGVALARVVHVRAELAIDGLIFALIASSLALTWHIVQSSSLRDRAGGAAHVQQAGGGPVGERFLRDQFRRQVVVVEIDVTHRSVQPPSSASNPTVRRIR